MTHVKLAPLVNKTLKPISELLKQVDIEAAEKIKRTDVYKQIVKDSCMICVTHITH